MPHRLPPLPYAYDALEPHIDAQTMEIHYSKHHQTYINNLNTALEGTSYAEVPVEDLLIRLDEMPPSLHAALINQGGGMPTTRCSGRSCRLPEGASPLANWQWRSRPNWVVLRRSRRPLPEPR